MPWEAWTTLATLGVMITLLVWNHAGPDIILLATLTLLACLGWFSDRMPDVGQLFLGFGNPGLITIALLYAVAAGLRHTGAAEMLGQWVLGRPSNATTAQARLMPPAACFSAFLNNTAVVAVFLPIVGDWARKRGISPSKVLIPLSYAAILGGMCTLIGTSTNLVVHGRMIEDPKVTQTLGMFDLAWVGLPCAILGFLYIVIAGRWLLPDRKSAIDRELNAREYAVEMIVEPDGPLVGTTIEKAGLRHLPGLYLTEIERDGEILAAVGRKERLHANDRLIFVGIVESVVDLRRIRGLQPSEDDVFKLNAPRNERALIEAVVSNRCPLVNKTIRDGRFRTVYNAAVIAVARNGQRLREKIGDIVLQPGDTLLMEAPASFADERRYSQDFYLVSPIEGSAPVRHEKAWTALGIMAVLVAVVGLEWISMLHGALLAAGMMWLTRCCTGNEARNSIDWQVLVVVGSAIGIGRAVADSGAAAGIADGLMSVTGGNVLLSLLAIFVLTNVFTELMTNVAAALLVYPIAVATAGGLELNPLPFLVVVMIAASASFATPIGYQTNLMIYGPGGYRYTDYMRIGIPLTVIIMVSSVLITYCVWIP